MGYTEAWEEEEEEEEEEEGGEAKKERERGESVTNLHSKIYHKT